MPFETQVDVVRWRSGKGNSSERGAARSQVQKLIRQQTGGQFDRWLFLPQALDIPDLLADMQSLRSAEPQSLECFERIASLDSPFAEAAISRFNRYYGRIGTPDLDGDGEYSRLDADG